MWCWRKKTETLWEERVRDAGLRENEGGTSNSGCSQPFFPFTVTAVQQGVEERQLQQGDWQRERHFLLTLAVRAFPSVTGVPLKSSVSPLHTSVRGKGCTRAARPAAPAGFVPGTQHRPCSHGGISAGLWERALLSRCLTPP